ncbi:SanA/YdcF family protein [Fluviispira multicolorata]|uniref:SanA/YdcF family protein n=1 Tax=Fluviispira multicolorata TaxID=2654512 RepID=UPI0013757556|nr:ElyC/SanA/YdcF family protein [Fluviispira multicolorata]
MIIKSLQIALKIFSILVTFLIAISFIIFAIFTITNLIVYLNSKNSPLPLTPKDYAIVLGASVHGDSLSGVLRARMETAIDLYNKKLVKNILMSGDGTDSNYSETTAMKKFALKNKIPEEILITDEKGYNTYATILRAKEIYNINSAYIISQNFHLTRAVWIAREIGIDADGVGAGEVKEKWYYSSREFFARTKDYFQIIFKVTPYDEKNFNL